MYYDVLLSCFIFACLLNKEIEQRKRKIDKFIEHNILESHIEEKHMKRNILRLANMRDYLLLPTASKKSFEAKRQV